MLQRTTMGLYRGHTNPTAASKALSWTEGEQQQPRTMLKSAFLKFPSAHRHAQRRRLSGSGVINWEFRFRCAMGQRSGHAHGSLSLLDFYLKIFKHASIAHSVLPLHPVSHKAFFAYVPPVITARESTVRSLGLERRRSSLQQPPGRSRGNSSKQLPPYHPGKHYISVREEDSVNAAGINKPACFLFQSEDKGGVCSARQYSQAL